MIDQQQMERRAVVVDDPALSPATRQRVTDELRAALGTDSVTAPAGRLPAPGSTLNPPGLGAWLRRHRLQLALGLVTVLMAAAIVALATGFWWMLPLAAGVHALATMTVGLGTLRLTTLTEHPAPEIAAALSEDGITSPDLYFSALVAGFQPTNGRGPGEIISPGFNERTADILDDVAVAEVEQRTAMTPTGAPSKPGGQGGAPDLVVWVTMASVVAISVIFPAIWGGGLMWLLTAVMIPLVAGWAVVQRLLMTGGYRIHGARPMIVISASVAVAVAVFCTVVARAFAH